MFFDLLVTRRQQGIAIGAMATLALLAIGFFLVPMIWDHGSDLFNGTANNNTTSNVTDVNLTIAMDLESEANKTIVEAENGIAWAEMGDGNWAAAQEVMVQTKDAYNKVSWAGTNMSKAPVSKERDILYYKLQNDSVRINKVNEKALALKPSSSLKPTKLADSSVAKSDSSVSGDTSSVSGKDSKTSAKKNLRGGIK